MADAAADELAGSVETLVHRLDVVLDHMGKGNTTQTVIHKSSSAGFIAGFAVACCIGSVVYAYNETNRLRDDMKTQVKALQDDQRDLKAWSEVLRGKVSRLEAEKQK